MLQIDFKQSPPKVDYIPVFDSVHLVFGVLDGSIPLLHDGLDGSDGGIEGLELLPHLVELLLKRCDLLDGVVAIRFRIPQSCL
jgi:hypothetical protein